MTRNAIRVRPIRSEEDHEAAVGRIAELIGAEVGTPEGDELDVLATLADAWEARNQPIDAPDPITAIQFRMEQQGLSRKDLEGMIGSSARVSEVLAGKRKLTIEMIRRIRSRLGISADLLIEPASAAGRSYPRQRRSAGHALPSSRRAKEPGAPRSGVRPRTGDLSLGQSRNRPRI